jgi:hypothetical protein
MITGLAMIRLPQLPLLLACPGLLADAYRRRAVPCGRHAPPLGRYAAVDPPDRRRGEETGTLKGTTK